MLPGIPSTNHPPTTNPVAAHRCCPRSVPRGRCSDPPAAGEWSKCLSRRAQAAVTMAGGWAIMHIVINNQQWLTIVIKVHSL